MNFPSNRATSSPASASGSDAAPPTNRAAARLLIVDDDRAHRNVLAVMLEEIGYVCKKVSSGGEALDVLRNEPMDAVLADLNMPGVSGMQLLAEIRLRYPHLVFLMATGVDDVRLGVHAMRQGADDYLIKPLQMDVVSVSLERAFRNRDLQRELEHYRKNLEAMVGTRTAQLQGALRQVEQSYAHTLDALGAVIDLRDDQLAGHSRRVALSSIQMMTRMHDTPEELKSLVMGAWLHDIGKLAIPDAILFKPGPLTDEERRIIQGHVQIGYDLVKRIPFLAPAAEIILTHHERWDGSGYPRGLKALDIPLNARIFAVADSLDAMTSDRPYRAAMPFQDARTQIGRLAGTLFDPQVVGIFLDIPDEAWEGIREQASTSQFSMGLAGICVDDPGVPAEPICSAAK